MYIYILINTYHIFKYAYKIKCCDDVFTDKIYFLLLKECFLKLKYFLKDNIYVCKDLYIYSLYNS